MVDIGEIQTAYYLVAATGVLVAAIYYVLNMRATLQTRQVQLFMGLYSRFSDETFHEASTDIRFMKWSDFDDFKNKVLDDPGKFRSLGIMVRFYEGIGVLVRERLIDMRFVYLLMDGDVRQLWEQLAPIIEPWRKAWSFPRLASETEYLGKSLLKYIDEHPEAKT